MAVVRKKPSSVPIYQKIERELLSMLDLGDHPPHSQFLTEVELCKRFNVNPITARKAVGRLVEQGRLYKVHRSGTFVSPPPRNRLVLLVTTNTQESKIGCLTPVAAKYPDLQWQELYIGDLRPHVSDIKHVYPKLIGALFVRDLPNCLDVMEALQKQGVAVCFCGSDVHAPFLENTHSVLCRESDLIEMSLRHLHENGCRRLGSVGTTDWPAFAARENAIREWCEANDIPVKEANILSMQMNDLMDPLICYERIKEYLLNPDFDADGIFCANDEVASNFVQAAMAVGVKIPKHLKVITTDDNDRFTDKIFPQISAVRLPIDLDIQEGLKLLSSKSLPPGVYERRCSDIHLIPRQSTEK